MCVAAVDANGRYPDCAGSGRYRQGGGVAQALSARGRAIIAGHGGAQKKSSPGKSRRALAASAQLALGGRMPPRGGSRFRLERIIATLRASAGAASTGDIA